MRYSAEHKQRTRDSILRAASRVFRAEGYGGSGIDGVTKAAGVTNGALYGHFRSKSEVFRSVVTLGLQELRAGIERAQAEHGGLWLTWFIDHYLGPLCRCEIANACALPVLSAEVARADDAARDAYAAEFKLVVQAMAAGLDGDEGRAVAILAMLSGAATFARAVSDDAAASHILAAARTSALQLSHCPAPAE